jgi:P27 family predicted phage terminase small subunit
MGFGRPRKTDKEHWLNGTTPHAPEVKPEEASQVASGRPKMPGHLSPNAIEAWKLVCKLLRAKGTLAKTDAATLEIYVEVKSTWIDAKADVVARGQLVDEQRYSKSGDPYTVTIINPSVQIQRDSERQLLQLTKALGLSPDTREKVRRTRKRKTEGDESNALMKAFPFLLTPKKADDDDEDTEDV